MRKLFLITLLPLMALVSGCAAYGKGHGGNCNCPKFGEQPVKKPNTEQASAAQRPSDLQ